MASVQDQKALMILKHTIEIQRTHLLSHFSHQAQNNASYHLQCCSSYIWWFKKIIQREKGKNATGKIEYLAKTFIPNSTSRFTMYFKILRSLVFTVFESVKRARQNFISHSCVNTDLKGGSVRDNLGFQFSYPFFFFFFFLILHFRLFLPTCIQHFNSKSLGAISRSSS